MTTETLMTEPTEEGQTAEGQAPTEGQPGDASAEGQTAGEGEREGQTDGERDQADQEAGKAEGETDDADGDKDKADEPPEEYQFETPEGVEMDEAVTEAYSEAAREAGLSQDKAQALLDKVSPIMAQRTNERIEAAKTEWTEAAQSDKEFGGDKLQENLGVAHKALETFGTPELQELLNESGLGNHPEVIRAFYRAGKAISEDQFVNGQTRGAQGGDARSLYSQSNMNP
ncbi:MAG: hypothetical protein U5L08_04395 [Xanthomonadales bacterium]|nr:hypothetical protein [Xanthomonadales bacterium]